jgi:hypothetical protein
LRTGSVAVVALVLLIVMAMPTLASAAWLGNYFEDQTGHYLLTVITQTGGFQVTSRSAPVLLCSGVGARITNGGLVLSLGSSYSAFGFASSLRCQAGVYSNIRGGGMIAGVITVILSGPTSVGYPSILVLSMTQTLGEAA